MFSGRSSQSRLYVCFNRFVANLCSFLIFYTYTLGVTPAYAQSASNNNSGIISDPEADVSFRPTISFSDVVGTPLIDIVAPENGVSHNRYSRFDVDENGVILNNSTTGNEISELAGALRANPNLQGLSAEIIINEVTSGDASELQGAIEVYGPQADVIIANPNGVTCDGCGFVNTNIGTLTTGLPTTQTDGSVDLSVSRGDVSVLRGGLEGVGANSVQLVGRNVSIDGQVSTSDRLTVSGGAQTFDAGTGEASATNANQSSSSSFAVDATQYGVMRAGRIEVMGNEAGLGVRTLGNLSSGDGGTSIMSLDDIIMGASNSTGAFQAQAQGDIVINEDLTAKLDVSINAGVNGSGSIVVADRGGVYSQGSADLSATADVDIGGDFQVLENLNVSASNIYSNAEITVLTGNVNLQASENINIAEGRVSGAAINIDAGGESRIGDTYIQATAVNVVGKDVALGDGAIFSADSVVLDALEDFENGAQILGNELNIDIRFTENFRNLSTGVYIWEAIELDILGRFINAGWVESETSINLAVASFENLSTGVITGSTIIVNSDGEFINAGSLVAETAINISAQKALMNTGRIGSNASVDIEAIGRIENKGTIIGGEDSVLTLSSLNSYINNVGIINVGDVTLTAEYFINNFGVVQATGDARFTSGAQFYNHVGSELYTGELLTVNAGTYAYNSGVISIGGNASLVSGVQFINHVGSELYTGGALSVDAGTYAYNNGLIRAVGGADIVSDTQFYNLTTGELYVGDALSVTSGTYAHNAGLISTVGSATILASASSFSNTGTGRIDVGGGLSVDVGGVAYNSGVINSAGAARFVSGAQFYNHVGSELYTGGALSVDTGTYAYNNGLIRAVGGADIVSDTQFYNLTTGELYVGDALSVTSGTYAHNAGLISTVGSATILASASSFSNTGTGRIDVGGGLSVDAGTYAYNRGLISTAGDASFVSDTQFYNHVGSELYTGGALSVDTGTYAYNSGVISSAGNANFVSGNQFYNLTTGELYVEDALSVTSGTYAHNAGLISTVGSATILASTSSFGNMGTGRIDVGGDLSVDAGAYAYNSGVISSAGNASFVSGNQFYNLTTGELYVGDALSVTSGTYAHNAGLISTVGNATILASASSFNNTGTGQFYIGGDLSVDAETYAYNSGIISSAGDASFVSDTQFYNHVGSELYTGGALSVDTGTYAYNKGVLAVSGNATVSSGTHFNNSGQITVSDNISIDSGANISNTGSIVVGITAAFIASGAFNNSGQITVSDNISIDSGTNVSNAGMIDSSGQIDIESIISVRNTGVIDSGQAMSIISNVGNVENYGVLRSLGSASLMSDLGYVYNGDEGKIIADTLSFEGGTLALNRGLIDVSKDLIARSENSGFINYGTGLVSVGKNLSVTSGAYLRNNGLIETGETSVFITTGSFENNGRISAGQGVSITAGGAVTNAAELISGGVVEVTAARIYDHGLLSTGSIDFTADYVETRRAGDYVFNGQIEADTYVANVGSWYSNTASILTAGSIEILSNIGNVDNRGVILSSDNLNLNSLAGSITNLGNIAVENNLNVIAAGYFANTGQGLIDVHNDANFQAGQGVIFSEDSRLTLNSGNLVINSKYHITNSGLIDVKIGDATLDITVPKSNIDGVFSNSASGRINVAGELLVSVDGNIFDLGELEASTVNYTAKHIQIRKDEVFTFNGVINAESLDAIVGKWHGMENSRMRLTGNANLSNVLQIRSIGYRVQEGNYVAAPYIAIKENIEVNGSVLISARGDLHPFGDLATQFGTANISVIGGNEHHLYLDSAGSILASANHESSGNIYISGKYIYNSAGRLTASGSISLNAQEFLITESLMTANESIQVTGGSIEILDGAKIKSNYSNVYVNATGGIQANGELSAYNNIYFNNVSENSAPVDLNFQTTNNTATTLTIPTTTTTTTTDVSDSSSHNKIVNDIIAGDNLVLVTGTGDIVVNTDGLFSIASGADLRAGRSLFANANAGINSSGNLNITNDLYLNTAGVLQLSQSQLNVNNLVLIGDNKIELNGYISGTGDIVFDTDRNLDISGGLSASDNLWIYAAATRLKTGSQLVAGRDLTIQTDGALVIEENASVIASRNLTVMTTDNHSLYNRGQLLANTGDIRLQAYGTYNLKNAQIEAVEGNVVIDARGRFANGHLDVNGVREYGSVHAGKDLIVVTGSEFEDDWNYTGYDIVNRGMLSADNSVILSTSYGRSILNEAGSTIQSISGDIAIASGSQLRNESDAKIRAYNSLIIQNIGALITEANSSVISGGDISVIIGGNQGIYNNGVLQSNSGNILLDAYAVYNLKNAQTEAIEGNVVVDARGRFANGRLDVNGVMEYGRVHAGKDLIVVTGSEFEDDWNYTGYDIVNRGVLSADNQLIMKTAEERSILNESGANIQSISGDLVITSGNNIVNEAHSLINSLNGSVQFVADFGYIENSGQIKSSTRDIDIYTDQGFMNVANGVQAATGISVTASSLIGASFEGLRTTGDFALTLTNGSLNYNAAQHEYEGDLYLNIAQNLTYSGKEQFQGNLSLIAGNQLTVNQDLNVSGDLLLESGIGLNLSQSFQAGDNLYLFAEDLTLQGQGVLSAENSLIIDVNGTFNNSGVVNADIVSISAASIENIRAGPTGLENVLKPTYESFWQAYFDKHSDRGLLTNYNLNVRNNPTGYVVQTGFDITQAGFGDFHYTEDGLENGSFDLPSFALSEADLAFKGGNGTISGREVYLDARDQVINSGHLHAEDILSITGAHLTNTNRITSADFIGIDLGEENTEGLLENLVGVIYGAGDVYIKSSGDILNQNGSIIADASAALTAGGSIKNLHQAPLRTFNFETSIASSSGTPSRRNVTLTARTHTQVFRHSEIVAGTQLWLEAGDDIINHGGRLAGGDDLVGIAGRDIQNLAVNDNYTRINSSHGCIDRACGDYVRDYSASEIASGGALELRAGQDIINSVSNIGGFTDSFLFAERDIESTGALVRFVSSDYANSSLFGLIKKRNYEESAFIHTANIQSLAGSLFLDATNDINLAGTIVNSTGTTSLRADGDINLTPLYTEVRNYARRRGFSGLSFSSNSQFWNDHEVLQTEVTGFDVVLDAGNSIHGDAAFVSAFNDLTLTAGQDITFDSETLNKYFYENGWSFGLTFPGSSFLDAVLTGQGLSGIGEAYVNENPFFSSVYALANSDTGLETAFNLANVSSRGASFFGTDVSGSYNGATRNSSGQLIAGTGGTGTFFQSIINASNPFAGATNPFNNLAGVIRGESGSLDALASNIGGNVGESLKSIGFNFSAHNTRRIYTENIESDLYAGRNATLTAGRDISLLGGTQLQAAGLRDTATDALDGGNINLSAGRDITLMAAHDRDSTTSSTTGISFALAPNTVDGVGFRFGANGNSSNSESDFYTAAGVHAGNELNLNAGRDISLIGAIATGRTANITAGRDMLIQSLQNTTLSENSGWGFSVTICGNGLPCAGSFNLNGGEGERRWADDVSGFFIEQDLTAEIGGTTALLGGALSAGLGLAEGWTPETYTTYRIVRSGEAGYNQFEPRLISEERVKYCEDATGTCQDNPRLWSDDNGPALSLTTGSLLVADLYDVDNNRQWGVSASLGDPANLFESLGSGIPAQQRFGGTTIGGNYSYSTRQGVTRATISEGDITLTDTNLSDSDKTALIAPINRNSNNIQSITRESSFDTGDLFLDVGALANLMNVVIEAAKARQKVLQDLNIDIKVDTSLINAKQSLLFKLANDYGGKENIPQHLETLVSSSLVKSVLEDTYLRAINSGLPKQDVLSALNNPLILEAIVTAAQTEPNLDQTKAVNLGGIVITVGNAEQIIDTANINQSTEAVQSFTTALGNARTVVEDNAVAVLAIGIGSAIATGGVASLVRDLVLDSFVGGAVDKSVKYVGEQLTDALIFVEDNGESTLPHHYKDYLKQAAKERLEDAVNTRNTDLENLNSNDPNYETNKENIISAYDEAVNRIMRQTENNIAIWENRQSGVEFIIQIAAGTVGPPTAAAGIRGIQTNRGGSTSSGSTGSGAPPPHNAQTAAEHYGPESPGINFFRNRAAGTFPRQTFVTNGKNVVSQRNVSVDAVTLKHVLDGDNKHTGGHSTNSGSVKTVSSVEVSAQGVRRANVEINGTLKSNTPNGESTLFPKNWSDQRILQEVKAAIRNGLQLEESIWTARTPSGVLVQFRFNGDRIYSFFPLFET